MSNSEPWPHAPPHFTNDAGLYMVTASTYGREPLLGSRKRLRFAQDLLLKLCHARGWKLQAWAILSNHYHFVAASPEGGGSELSALIKQFHAGVAVFLNRIDEKKGRKVWHNYWESQLTYERSYLARLNYVNENAVHHGIVKRAAQYPWCSAAWFRRVASPSFYKTVRSFPIDALKVKDDF